jgi:type I restriction enzyme, S subunit
VLRNYPVLIPPTPLFQMFDRLVRDSVDQIQNMFFRIKNLRRTRDLLLPKLISGEVNIQGNDIKSEFENDRSR